MQNIEVKFIPGDDVFLLMDGNIVNGEVQMVSVNQENKRNYVIHLNGQNMAVEEIALFSSPEEVTINLLDRFKQKEHS